MIQSDDEADNEIRRPPVGFDVGDKERLHNECLPRLGVARSTALLQADSGERVEIPRASSGALRFGGDMRHVGRFRSWVQQP